MKKLLSLLLAMIIIVSALPCSAFAASNTVTVTLPGIYHYDYVKDVLNGTNALRANVGASALTLDADLTRLAMQRAAECAFYFSHTRPNGEDFHTVTAGGTSWSGTHMGENIAAGAQTAQIVVTGWANSPGHYENIINTGFTRIGIGSFTNNGVTYWTQAFSNGTANTSSISTTALTSKASVSTLTSNLSPYLSSTTTISTVTGGTAELPRVLNRNDGYTTVLYPTISNSNNSAASVAVTNEYLSFFSLTGKGAGTGTLNFTAYSGQPNSLSVPFSVVSPSIKLNTDKLSIGVYETVKLTASVTPAGQTVTWSSSNDAVAAVGSGTVTGIAVGTAKITATMVCAGKTYTASCDVTVTDSGTSGGGGSSGEEDGVIVATGSAVNITGNSAGITGSVKAATPSIQKVCVLLGIDTQIMIMPYSQTVDNLSSFNVIHELTNLKPNTTYYYLVYAIVDGEEYAGEIRSFTTGEESESNTPTEKDPEIQDGNIPGTLQFRDVPKTAYCYNAVEWAVANGVTTGMTETTFVPDGNCTRAQAVTFLWRAAGKPNPTAITSPFSDVQDAGSWYYKAVLWAYERGITTGTDTTHFDPDGSVTRGQMVTFLWRMHNKPSAFGSTFSDVPASEYFYNAVLWATATNITNGMGNGRFEPNTTCTRGHIVTFLYRDLMD